MADIGNVYRTERALEDELNLDRLIEYLNATARAGIEPALKREHLPLLLKASDYMDVADKILELLHFKEQKGGEKIRGLWRCVWSPIGQWQYINSEKPFYITCENVRYDLLTKELAEVYDGTQDPRLPGFVFAQEQAAYPSPLIFRSYEKACILAELAQAKIPTYEEIHYAKQDPDFSLTHPIICKEGFAPGDNMTTAEARTIWFRSGSWLRFVKRLEC